MNVALCNLPDALIDVLRRYATLCPIRTLQFPNTLPFHQVHDFLLNHILLHPFFISYPPSPQYQQQFWKWTLAHLESMPMEEDDEIDYRLYHHHVSLVSRSTTSYAMGFIPPLPSYFTYFWRQGGGPDFESATLLESRTTIESGTTGLKTWGASLVLAQFLTVYSGLVRGKRLLELGSGAGLLGIIAANIQLMESLACESIYLTDVNPEVLARCAENLSLPCNKSSSHPSIKTVHLDWTDSLDPIGIASVHDLLEEASPDVILGADIVYDPGIISSLVEILRLALEHQGRIALIALTERNQDTLAQFIQAARMSLCVEQLQVTLADMRMFWGISDFGDSIPDQNVKVFQLSTRPNGPGIE
ncbi:uncharacterized protein PHACADRAFT_168858 [Phanerochaete carnosa HHB-10118-sp]|uniref:FAM86 N-terminal domain-containing protein n=1 Tax=Phanerochaete carnosa (strain HHB-10118-sp) TaxID=650164 RepID=K5VEI4_PHACS|nr:uncharacterized protein PHACADRAFT_168858 [Phanerochaete carnosa HHB-10118-sp]EKM61411.1 hypothetical protein PHACADRAFT_168858 [Phanerochaete carnosa HHB-10118-sp]